MSEELQTTPILETQASDQIDRFVSDFGHFENNHHHKPFLKYGGIKSREHTSLWVIFYQLNRLLKLKIPSPFVPVIFQTGLYM